MISDKVLHCIAQKCRYLQVLDLAKTKVRNCMRYFCLLMMLPGVTINSSLVSVCVARIFFLILQKCLCNKIAEVYIQHLNLLKDNDNIYC